MARLDSFLRLVVEQRASDLHFHSGNKPIIRFNGDMVPLPFRQLSERETMRFLFEIMTPKQRKEFEEKQDVDFVYSLPDLARFRANVFTQSHGIGSVFRVIPNNIMTLDDLNLPRAIRKLCHLESGLVLVTGATGSGKTTTLAAMIDEVNTHTHRHVITIEDPIEFIHPQKNSMITQRQIGKHALSFADALRSAMRETPDVVVVGELRDVETITQALSAAETGVLVLGTLHSNTAAKAVDRLLNVLPEESQEQVRSVLSVVLRGVVSQNLCKRATGDGRVAAMEILVQTFAVSNMIREGKIHQIDAYMDTQSKENPDIQTMDRCLLNLVRGGVIDAEEGVKFAKNPDKLRMKVSDLLLEEE